METKKRVVIYDFETNGFWNGLNQPIEACFKVIENGKEVEVYHCYIKCKYRLNPFITCLTGITDKMLEEKGIELPDAFKEIDRIVNTPNTLLVGHNILTFDNKFLNYYLQLYLHKEITNSICFDTAGQLKAELIGFNLEDFESIDKMHSKALSKTIKGLHYKLSDALKHYGIRHEDRLHGAKSDVEATSKVYFEQIKRGLPKGSFLDKENETDLLYRELINDEKKKQDALNLKVKSIAELKNKV